MLFTQDLRLDWRTNMGGLRRLRRKSADRYAVEPLHDTTKPRGGKLSAVILDFAQPLIDELGDDDFEAAIAMAVFCWNIALFPDDEQERELRSLVRQMAKGAPGFGNEIETWARRLVDRKKTLFASDRRMIANHTVVMEGDFFHLYVVSTPVPR